MDRREVERVVRGYFDAIDRYDVEGVVSWFSEDCVVTMEPPHNVWHGRAGVTEWLTTLFATTSGMEHANITLSVDESLRRATAEQNVMVAWNDQPRSILHNVTVLDVNENSLLSSVSFWLGHDQLATT